jgi:hypothetical protein
MKAFNAEAESRREAKSKGFEPIKIGLVFLRTSMALW